MTRHDRSMCRKISAAKDKWQNFAFERSYTISFAFQKAFAPSYRLHLQDNFVIQISLSTSPNSFAALYGLFVQDSRIEPFARSDFGECREFNPCESAGERVILSLKIFLRRRFRFLEFHVKLTCCYFVIILHSNRCYLTVADITILIFKGGSMPVARLAITWMSILCSQYYSVWNVFEMK